MENEKNRRCCGKKTEDAKIVYRTHNVVFYDFPGKKCSECGKECPDNSIAIGIEERFLKEIKTGKVSWAYVIASIGRTYYVEFIEDNFSNLKEVNLMNNNCSECGGKREEKRISYSYTAFGPKSILLQNIPGKKCNDCGAETVNVDTANQVTEFLKKVAKELVNFTEKDGLITARFPDN